MPVRIVRSAKWTDVEFYGMADVILNNLDVRSGRDLDLVDDVRLWAEIHPGYDEVPDSVVEDLAAGGLVDNGRARRDELREIAQALRGMREAILTCWDWAHALCFALVCFCWPNLRFRSRRRNPRPF